MFFSIDSLASLFMAVSCVALLALHRWMATPRHYPRVAQQGATFVLGRRLMDAGFWMVQPLVRACTASAIGPDIVTWSSLGPALGASIAAAIGHWGIAAWTLLASALLDVLDGAVARATNEVTAAGAVLDSVLDRYSEAIFFAGVLVFYRQCLPAQLIAVAALIGSFLISYSSAKAEAIHVVPPRGSMKRSDRLTMLIVGSALTPLYQFFNLPRADLAWPMLMALSMIAALANASAIRRFHALGVAATAVSPPPRVERPTGFPVRPRSPLQPNPR